MAQNQKSYDNEFKAQAVKLAQEIGGHKAAQELGIPKGTNHPSWVFSAGQIYEEVWGEDGENCGTAVASVIGQIRRKLTPDMPKAGYIRTVLGSGYKFEVPQGMAE